LEAKNNETTENAQENMANTQHLTMKSIEVEKTLHESFGIILTDDDSKSAEDPDLTILEVEGQGAFGKVLKAINKKN